MPMSNNIRFGRNRLTDANERPHRAGKENGHWNEKRKRSIDVIIPACQVVAHFVAAEDPEDREAVPQAPMSQAVVDRFGRRSEKSLRKLA